VSKPILNPQVFLNGEIHDWYRIIWGYNDKVVGSILDKFDIPKNRPILDPFCGTGTTLIECKKRSISSIGIDANPAACFATKAKTHWALKPAKLLQLKDDVLKLYRKEIQASKRLKEDSTFRYITDSGMVSRGWISPEPLFKAVALKRALEVLPTSPQYRRMLKLALIAEVVNSASNVRFGPELYCSSAKLDHDVISGFNRRVDSMAVDLDKVSKFISTEALVIHGDSRNKNALAQSINRGSLGGIVCSPPYPTEHDYTRNTRLELAFLDYVRDLESLRKIKRQMVRSHTKGIYSGDNEQRFVNENTKLNLISRELDERAASKNHGFARLYSKVVREYFGGMAQHFSSVKAYLHKSAVAAYVVGDQASYLQVQIPTAEILAEIAEQLGFDVVEIMPWRDRWATKTSRHIRENILLLRRKSDA
jgi:hypothetical protein